MKTQPLPVRTGNRLVRSTLLIGSSLILATAQADTYHWTGDHDNDWSDSRNWSPSGVPGPGDDVIVATRTVNAGGNRTVHSLTVSGGTVNDLSSLTADIVNLSSGTLNAATITTAHFHASGGAVYGTLISLSDASTWTGGYIKASVTVEAGASISIPSGVPDLAYMTLTNHGTVTMSGGQIRGYENVIIENHGTWALDGHHMPFIHYYSGNQFNNHGLLQNSGATVHTLANNWTYTLGGETRSNEGTLQFASLTILPAAAQLTGSGTMQITGPTQLTGTVSKSVATLELAGGTITCSGTAAFTGTLVWTTGNLTGAFTVQSGSTLSVSGDELHQLNNGASIDNHGTILWNGSAPIQGYENNTIHNHSGGTFEIAADGSPLSHHYGGLVFQNDGTLIKSAGPGAATLVSWTYHNNGSFVCNSGVLECQSITNLNNGSSLQGTAEIRLNGTTSISGTVSETVQSLRMTGGTLTGTVPCGVTGQLDWEGGIIYGTLGVPAGSVLAVHGPDFKEIHTNSAVDVHGTLRWTGAKPIRFRENSILHIQPGGICDLAADGDPFDHNYGGNEVINEGTLVKSAGSGGITTCDTLTIRNRGDIRCESSTLEFTSQNTLVFEDSSTISGPGQVLLRSTMQLPGTVAITAPTTWSEGSLTGSGGSITGPLDWSGGYSFGSWQVATGGHLKVITGIGTLKRLENNAVLEVGGVLELASGGFTQYQNSLVKVLSGGRCEVTGITAIPTHYGGNVFEIDPDGLLASTTGGDLRVDSAVINNGSISLPAGTITCNGGGGPSTGPFHADAGATLVFSGGIHDLDAGTTVTGPGNVRVTGGNLRALASVDVFAHIDGGTVEGFAPDGHFRFRDGSSWVSGYMAGNIRIPAGTTVFADGTGAFRRMNRYTRMDIGGRLRWQGPGYLQSYQDNVIEIHPTGTLELTTDGIPIAHYYSGSNLLNHGTILKSGGSGDATLQDLTYANDGVIDCSAGRIAIKAPLTLGDGGTITGSGRTALIAQRTTLEGTTTVTGSTLDLAGAELYGSPGTNATITGQNIEWSSGYIGGQVTWNGIAATTTGGFRQINLNGALRNAGTFTLTGSGSIQLRERSTLRNLPTGTLNATGTTTVTDYFGGNQFINEGTMTIGASPGRMVVSSPFEQTATGRLVVGIAGPGTDFDVLVVQETATLAGTLVATMEGGYNPPAGTTFEVVDATTRIGTFTQTLAPRFDVTYPLTPGDPPVSHHNVVLVSKDSSSLDYDTWAGDHELSGTDALAGADPDADGSSNWIEYALNMNPKANDTQPLSCTMESTPTGDRLVLRYRRWDNRVGAGVRYQPEACVDLSGWSPAGVTDEADPDAPEVTGSEARKASVPLSETRHFLHLLLTETTDPS